MAFEQMLREKINSSPFGSKERNLLKVVLGEWQQKTAIGKTTDELGQSIVKKMIKANEENIGLLALADERRDDFVVENKVLAELLPQYLSAAQITAALAEVDLKTPASEGAAVGLAMQHLKKLNANVEGQTVKKVVAEIRKV